jgi:hypothetical protein
VLHKTGDFPGLKMKSSIEWNLLKNETRILEELIYFGICVIKLPE